MHEPDGVGEAVEELLRSGLAAAGALARAHVHARAEQLRAAAEGSEQPPSRRVPRLRSSVRPLRARLAPLTQTRSGGIVPPHREIAHTSETAPRCGAEAIWTQRRPR